MSVRFFLLMDFGSLINDLGCPWTYILKNCNVFNEGYYTEG